MRLAGKIAIITGAAQGIGEATTLRFLEEGALVVANDLSSRALAEAEFRGHPRVVPICCDVADPEAPRMLVETALQRFGRIDVLVNNAASFVQKGAETATREEWLHVLDVNVIAPAMLIRECAPHLRQSQGNIVNVASMSGVIAQKNFSTYAASKAALIHMTRSLAIDFANDKVRVNSICPGVVVTSQSYREVRNLGMSFEQWRDDLAPRHILGRLGEPTEIASAILFLASDEASFITASVLMADGGYHAW